VCQPHLSENELKASSRRALGTAGQTMQSHMIRGVGCNVAEEAD